MPLLPQPNCQRSKRTAFLRRGPQPFPPNRQGSNFPFRPAITPGSETRPQSIWLEKANLPDRRSKPSRTGEATQYNTRPDSCQTPKPARARIFLLFTPRDKETDRRQDNYIGSAPLFNPSQNPAESRAWLVCIGSEAASSWKNMAFTGPFCLPVT